MQTLKDQRGIAHFGLIVLVVLVMAVIGFAAWRIGQKDNGTSSSQTSTSTTATVSEAPAVTSTADLDAALSALDQNDPTTGNADDLSALDAELNSF